ncbi:Two-component system sensor histidine kinase [Citrifermentans bremense]|uniref:histidine kinase n=1 Tax=Citrifermentans bremense TaxID=60035 RepID=A0A6S6M4N2_9BACT|nr:PAS domain-containing sensor histidine kinase [Citrifermentans bremense]BCG46611.1 Two-component system sensor histidine kinase [Citrifermentans bremense]
MAKTDIDRVTAELERLKQENEVLSGQVKRLVKAESRLYDYQEKLDLQLKEYSALYDLNSRLYTCHDLPAIFELASEYVINRLDYERVLFFQKTEKGDAYSVCACDGYHYAHEKEAVSGLTLSCKAAILAPLFAGANYSICTEESQLKELVEHRDLLLMNEYFICPLGNRAEPVALLAVGNSAENAEFYRRISDSEEALFGLGNLVGLLSSTIENQILYTGMKKALEQERLAEAKYRGIFENAMEGIFQTTPEGRFLSCNPATAAILGYSTPEEVLEGVVNVGLQLYVDPSRRAELYAMMFQRQDVKNFEVEFCRRDGSRIWVDLSTRPAFDEEGKLIYIDGVIQDITERKQNEEALRKLSQAVEQSPVSIVITDTKGRIEFVNPKFVQLTGYSLEEVLGKNPRILNSGKAPVEKSRNLWETICAGKVWEGEFLNRKKDGELFSEHATISPIRNKDGVITHFLAIKEDITERKLLEAQLFQSQKMESIGRLAGGVAHDFNNMLSVILGSAQLAMRCVTEGTPVWQDLEQIVQAGKRSSQITRQLLAFSRKEIIAPREVNLNEHFTEMQKTLGRLIGEDIRMEFKPAPELWTIDADTTQLDQILVNLAVNARDAMGNGGVLTIQTANIRVDASYSQFHLDASLGEYVQLSVSDTGCGMDRETLSQIFEPFFTTKEVGKGTGLGLATVYGIVRQHNGFINVYSEPGQGTTFEINFPKFSGSPLGAAKDEAVAVSGSGTVLLVEDDPLVRKTTLDTLKEIGYQVIEAAGAEEAISICREKGTHVDLILTDVVMPGMNGKEMVDAIEAFRPGLRVLFMSGYTKDLVAQRGVAEGGRHFIQKPFDIHALAGKLRETLQQKSLPTT